MTTFFVHLCPCLHQYKWNCDDPFQLLLCLSVLLLAIEAMKKAYQEELSRELSKTRSLQQGPESLRKQHQ